MKDFVYLTVGKEKSKSYNHKYQKTQIICNQFINTYVSNQNNYLNYVWN